MFPKARVRCCVLQCCAYKRRTTRNIFACRMLRNMQHPCNTGQNWPVSMRVSMLQRAATSLQHDVAGVWGEIDPLCNIIASGFSISREVVE